jgi:multidrug transporter EmrE-like cation transporter
VGLSALVGAFMFREKLSKVNLAGIVLAVLAIVLIAL